MHIPGYRQERSGSAYEPRNCNIGAEQPLCNQPCSCPAQPRLPHPKQALGIQSSKCRIHNLPCVQMKKNCCQGNTQISKLKYSSALNEPERSCRKFTQVQQRFLAECGEEIIKRDPSSVVEAGEGAQHNFAMQLCLKILSHNFFFSWDSCKHPKMQ